MTAIQPADVFEQVLILQRQIQLLVYVAMGVAVLVVVQIVAKIVIFGRVVGMLQRAERILEMSETHASVTDSQRDRVGREIRTSTTEVIDRVEKVPDKVVERLEGSERQPLRGRDARPAGDRGLGGG